MYQQTTHTESYSMEDDSDADTCILKFSDTELPISKRTLLRILDPKKTEPNRDELIAKHRLLMKYQREEVRKRQQYPFAEQLSSHVTWARRNRNSPVISGQP